MDAPPFNTPLEFKSKSQTSETINPTTTPYSVNQMPKTYNTSFAHSRSQSSDILKIKQGEKQHESKNDTSTKTSKTTEIPIINVQEIVKSDPHVKTKSIKTNQNHKITKTNKNRVNDQGCDNGKTGLYSNNPRCDDGKKCTYFHRPNCYDSKRELVNHHQVKIPQTNEFDNINHIRVKIPHTISVVKPTDEADLMVGKPELIKQGEPWHRTHKMKQTIN